MASFSPRHHSLQLADCKVILKRFRDRVESPEASLVACRVPCNSADTRACSALGERFELSKSPTASTSLKHFMSYNLCTKILSAAQFRPDQCRVRIAGQIGSKIYRNFAFSLKNGFFKIKSFRTKRGLRQEHFWARENGQDLIQILTRFFRLTASQVATAGMEPIFRAICRKCSLDIIGLSKCLYLISFVC